MFFVEIQQQGEWTAQQQQQVSLLPSTETGFHAGIYGAREDIQAILHAHAPCLVAFAICGRSPCSRVLARGALSLGKVIPMTSYRLPGLPELIRVVSEAFRDDASVRCVILGSHGVVVAAETLREAFSRLEVLENCAAVAIRCRSLLAHSAPTELTESQVRCLFGRVAEVRSLCVPMPQIHTPSEAECELRMVLAQVVQRALRQKNCLEDGLEQCQQESALGMKVECWKC